MSKGMKVVICSSAAFYEHAIGVKDELVAAGVEVIVPKTARAMEQSGNYEVEAYKTWYENADDYDKKAELMRTHFDEITNGDSILVINDEKHGKPGYIGPNVLMEMSLAWYQKKPIYILNDLPKESPFEEELKGMMPVILKGNLERLIRDAQQ